MNMANWRMDVNFFYDFPGLVDDVPAANYMPLRTVIPRLGLTSVPFQAERRKSQSQLNVQGIEPLVNGQLRYMPPQQDDGTGMNGNTIRTAETATWNGGFMPFAPS